MTADTVGGVLTYACELIAGLRERDAEVVLATFGRRPSVAQRRRLRATGVTRVYESELALEWMNEPWDELAHAQRWLLELERRERPDVIHLNGYGHAAAPWRAPVVVVAHSCVWSWWQAVHGTEPPLGWARYRRWVRAGLHAAAAVVAPSRTMLAELDRHYGRYATPRSVIHNASSVPPASATVVKRPVALAAGRFWDPAKNIALLAGAAAELPNGVVRVAGEAGEAAGRGALTLLGVLGERALGRERGAAAVFVAPARYEPFGLAILEAARDRCALLLGDIPSLRELWGDAATYISPDDPRALTRAVREMLNDPQTAATLGQRAQTHSLRYAVAPMAHRYRELYEDLAEGRRVAVAR